MAESGNAVRQTELTSQNIEVTNSNPICLRPPTAFEPDSRAAQNPRSLGNREALSC